MERDFTHRTGSDLAFFNKTEKSFLLFHSSGDSFGENGKCVQWCLLVDVNVAVSHPNDILNMCTSVCTRSSHCTYLHL